MDTKTPDFKTLWDTCKIDDSRLAQVKSVCGVINAHIEQYKEVEAATKVPWTLIAALHYRESSLNFNTCLHNGDPLNKVTVHVPKGRGPFKSWSEAAIDALKYDSLHVVKYDSYPAMLVMAERFNGLGYRRTGELSPYVWAGTNHHDETGKYVADGKFSATAIEKQLGIASILIGLKQS